MGARKAPHRVRTAGWHWIAVERARVLSGVPCEDADGTLVLCLLILLVLDTAEKPALRMVVALDDLWEYVTCW